MNRRSFIKTTAAFSTVLILPRLAWGKTPSSNGKLNVAIIGVGGRGRTHVDGFKDENFIGFCDVDEAQAAETYAAYPDVPRYKDFRKLLDDLGGKLDAISIATPDHMHYPIALRALMMGINVYCEKPLVRTIWEARQLKAAAAKAGVITQMGNQGHTYEGLRYVKEWTQADIIGKVQEVHHWTDRPIWPQGKLKTPRKATPIPSTLDYDLWLGVAPKRSYDPNVIPFNWRGWKDYGCGAVGDMACHVMDSSFSGLQLGIPLAIDSDSSGHDKDTYPESSTIRFEFANPRGGAVLPVTWYDGARLPNLSTIPGVPDDFFAERADADGKVSRDHDNGTFIVGDKGVIWTDTYSSTIRVYPDTYFTELRTSRGLPPKELERVKGGPFTEFIEAIKAKRPAGSPFSYAAEFTETVLLGLVALEARKRIEYDASRMKVTNSRSANRYLESRYEYRKEFLPI